MPKAARPSQNTPASKRPALASSSATPKAAPKKLYSSFLSIPLSLPSPIPIPSSSSKPLAHVTHHIYVRAYLPRSAQAADSIESGPSRTAYVANLPVDLGERELRGLFARWGVVESVEIPDAAAGGNALEAAVRGLEPEADLENSGSESDEDNDGEGENDREVTGADGDSRPEPRFLGDGQTLLPRSKRPRRRPALPPSIPEVTPLSSSSPRSTPYGPSGSRTARITYLDPLALSRCLSYAGSPIPLDSTSADEPTGLAYYVAQHAALGPPLSAVKAFADSSMARFDHLQSLLLSSRARQAGAGALVDEDGFTVVVRGGRYGRTGGRGDGRGTMGVGVAKRGFEKTALAPEGGKKKGRGAGELMDFYKFQRTERKRQELADLRLRFEEDKQKVEEMKKAKRFKPY